jgi:ParB family transcriptional regulator, chromosome partitioning protein
LADDVCFPVGYWQDCSDGIRRPGVHEAPGLAWELCASGQRGEAMPQQKRGLGKGLGALIPTAATAGLTAPPGTGDPGQYHAAAVEAQEDVGAYFEEIPVGAITPNPRQPRQVFDEEALEELAESIKVVGLLQPVVVRKVMPGHYELIMGERRWRACEIAGLSQIPAIVRETSDDDMLRDALIENLQRQQLNPLEEAAAYAQLLEDFSATHEELARKIGRSRPHISNTIRLLNLPANVQNRVAAGVLSAGHAKALLGVENLEDQEHLAYRIVAEGLSVRAVEEIVALGAQAAKAPGQRDARPKPVAPGLKELADRLSDAFDTRVKVELGQRKGKIVVEFASLDDLERIVKTMHPGWNAQSRSA